MMTARPLARRVPSMMMPMRPNPLMFAPMQRCFAQIQVQPQRERADWNQSDDVAAVKPISLEEFYSTIAGIEMSDEEALGYMTFAADISYVSFKDQAEMMSFKGDFQAALAFIQKLDEVDVSAFLGQNFSTIFNFQ